MQSLPFSPREKVAEGRMRDRDYSPPDRKAPHPPPRDTFSPGEKGVLVMLLEPFGEVVDIVRRPARDLHAEVQAHLRQHLLDLV